MEKIRLLITQDATGDYNVISEISVKADRLAIYVAKDSSMWLYDPDAATEFIITPRMYEMQVIGDTQFGIIYPVSDIFVVDGMRYVAGECLIMNLEEDGIRCMSTEESKSAFVEFASRIKTICRKGYKTFAYLLDE